MFVDGGCLCRVPVQVVKNMGADVVVAVDVLKNAGEPVEKGDNIIELVLRVFAPKLCLVGVHNIEHS